LKKPSLDKLKSAASNCCRSYFGQVSEDNKPAPPAISPILAPDNCDKQPKTDSTTKPSRKKRILIYSVLALLVIAVILGLYSTVLYKKLLQNPFGFQPQANEPQDQISKYLTHYISPQVYNGIQLGEPFEIQILDSGINQIIAATYWPKGYDKYEFSMPRVYFRPGCFEVVSAVKVGEDIELFISIINAPAIDQNGKIALPIKQVQIGTVDVTTLALLMAKNYYTKNIEPKIKTKDKWKIQLAQSILEGEGFEPVFKIEDKYVRLQNITFHQGVANVLLMPITKK